MSDIVIAVENLGKKYAIQHQQQRSHYKTLRETIAQKAANITTGLFRRRDDAEHSRTSEEFWALRNVSFDIGRGEVLGIIGRNGAGKSTLLKVLSRVTEPSEGRVTIRGRVASLLEVGTGFHPELTGRENIFLNGSILGMARAEIRRKFDEIVEFAEVEKFLDTPVKRYSSGMYVRLAFAVAAHLEPEILIVDEVLAVGDLQFQQKCLGKMKDVSRSGRTVLFVSHNMSAINSLCGSAILIKRGTVAARGGTADCIRIYVEDSTGAADVWERASIPSSTSLGFTRIALQLVGDQPSLTLHVDCAAHSRGDHKPAFVAVDIADETGTVLMQALPTLECMLSGASPNVQFRISIDLPPLIPGRYFITTWMGPHNTETYDMVTDAVAFDVTESPTKGRSFPHTRNHGNIVPHSRLQLFDPYEQTSILLRS